MKLACQTRVRRIGQTHHGTVHIHLARPDPNSPFPLTLHPLERQRMQHFKFANDRWLYGAARTFLRQTLSLHAPLPPSAWQFNTNPYGKPFITNPGYEWLQFNLSHTPGLVACAVSEGQVIGVDVERLHPLDDLEALCSSVFAPLETQAVLAACTQHEREQRFFTYWTLKEAYIKARGLGIPALQQFAFQATRNGGWQLHCSPALQDAGHDWHFLSMPIGTEHYLGMAVYTNTRVLLAAQDQQPMMRTPAISQENTQ